MRKIGATVVSLLRDRIQRRWTRPAKFFIRNAIVGITVILDVVYNHFNHHADRAEWMYDTNGNERNAYYWYEGSASDYPAFDRDVQAPVA